ncbi:hypothetical protein N7449_003499 [Penicillium cf. viridicatum]|uniref:Secreted protein n=1 Tax=Penicillium cf. viridicatum TaxID=2972119 RepID=A0A9W9T5C2_9EURO|nr:hypothetical protein N7449_003499 [Penicillium cf. viridicatum]
MKSINSLYMLVLLAGLSIAAPAASADSIARSKRLSDETAEPLQWIKREEDETAEPLQWIKRGEDETAEPLQWMIR